MMLDGTIDIQYQTAWQKYVELSGSRADLLYNLDHLEMATLIPAILIATVFCLLVFGVYCCYMTACMERGRTPRWAPVAFIALAVMVAVIAVIAVRMGYEYSFNHQLADVEAQLDALERTWGFGA